MATIAALTALVPTSGLTAESAPTLAGSNVISSLGPAGIEVILPQDSTLILGREGENRANLATESGSFAGIMITELYPSIPGGVGNAAMFVKLFPPLGCNAQRCEIIEYMWGRWRVDSPDFPVDRIDLPAGRYALYMLGEENSRVSSQLELRGLAGSTTLEATNPIDFSWAMPAMPLEVAGQQPYAEGGATSALSGPGAVHRMTWALSEAGAGGVLRECWGAPDSDMFDEDGNCRPETEATMFYNGAVRNTASTMLSESFLTPGPIRVAMKAFHPDVDVAFGFVVFWLTYGFAS